MTSLDENLGQLSLRGLEAEEAQIQSSQQQSTQLIDVLDNYVIFSTLCSYLDHARILPLKRVTRRWLGHISSHLKERWNINKKLKRFVADPESFRTELGRHDALISGSFAIQFFDGVVWEESDLDLYIPEAKAEELGHYLIMEEGYELQASSSLLDATGYPDNEADLVRTATYLRTWTSNSGERQSKIQIMSSASLPIWSILVGFHSTVVVNVISWKKAYSIFPDATFLERETFVLQRLDEGSQNAIAKYAERGWKNWTSSENQRPESRPMPRSSTSSENQRPESIRMPRSLHLDIFRRVGDTKTWIVKLDIESVVKPLTPDFVLEHACFCPRMLSFEASSRRGLVGPSFEVFSALYEHPVLRYKYCEVNSMPFWSGMQTRLNDLARVEIEKLDEEDRPDWFTAFFAVPDAQGHPNYNFLDPLDKPSTWTYYDDLVPQWYADWESARKEAGTMGFRPASDLLRETEPDTT